MKYLKSGKYIDYKIVLIEFSLCCFHVVIVNNQLLSGLFAYLELFVLMFALLKRRIDLFLIFFVVIISSSFEYALFVDENLNAVSSPTSLPILMGYPFLLISLVPLIELIANWKYFLKKLNSSNSGLKIIYRFSLFAISTGCIIGILSILTNDNNVSALGLTFFFKDFSRLSLFCLLMIYFIYATLMYEKFYERLNTTLLSVLIGAVSASLFSVCAGYKGTYGDGIVLMPLSMFFSTSVFLFLFYKKYAKGNIVLFSLLTLLSFFIQFSFSNALSGKSWLVLFLYFIAILMVLHKKSKTIAYSVIIVTVLFSTVSVNFIENRKDNDSLSSTKLSQAMSVFAVADLDWYDNMPLSPKIRFEEFLNTAMEYLEKPCYSVFGKGYGGSHKDHRNSYGRYNPAAFSLAEYNNGSFILMHETLNTVFLKFGLFGVIFFFFICIKGSFSYYKSPWLVIGVVWFLFFFGYSYSLAAIGIPALIMGFYLINK